jgi:hypothetical protein
VLRDNEMNFRTKSDAVEQFVNENLFDVRRLCALYLVHGPYCVLTNFIPSQTDKFLSDLQYFCYKQQSRDASRNV